jgi:hypothetical protein
MEKEPGMTSPESAQSPGEDGVPVPDGMAPRDRSGPTWRGFAVSIIVAVVLSVMATLLLGGSWSSFSLRPAAAGSATGCGSGAPCCPPDTGR